MKSKLLTILVLAILVSLAVNHLKKQLQVEAETVETAYEDTEQAFQNIKTKNQDFVRLLNFTDRSLPVVQSKDNKEYLSRDPDGEYDRMGTLFQAAEVNAASRNIVIYGHSSSRNNARLTPLKDKKYIQANLMFTVTQDDQQQAYQIIAYFNVDLEHLDIAFYQTDWRNDSDFRQYLQQAQDRSLLPGTPDITADSEECLTLVTCDLRHKSHRWIVVAVPLIA